MIIYDTNICFIILCDIILLRGNFYMKYFEICERFIRNQKRANENIKL